MSVQVHEWSPALGGDMATDGNTVRALNGVQFKKKRYASTRTRGAVFRDVATSVLESILQNKHEHEFMQKKWTAAITAIRRDTRVYEQTCAAQKTLPNMAVVEDIAQLQMIKSRMWLRERCTDERLAFYRDVICRLWTTVVPVMTQNRTETHMKTFALGCLFKLQHGFTVNNNTIIPEDDWLSWNLPLAGDIKAYGHSKRSVTAGRTALLEAFKHLVETKQLKRADMDVTSGTTGCNKEIVVG
jgi:hypothetical protein